MRLDPISRLAADYLAALEKQKPAADAGMGQYIPHKPQLKQETFLALDCREALFGGAAGGGKSDALLMAALQYVHLKDYHALLLRKTYQELALPGAIMSRSHEWLDHTDAHWSGDNKRWTFPSGATLSFGYMETTADLARYQSAAFQFIGWDELTHFEESKYRYMFSRCRRLKGTDTPIRIRAATNPGGVGHDWVKRRWGIPDEVDFKRVYEHRYQTRTAGERMRAFVPANRHDNEALDQDEYSEMLEELDDVTRLQLDEGKWVRDKSGLVYWGWDDARNQAKALPQLSEAEGGWIYLLGCDFGVSNATAFVVGAMNQHHPTLYVVRSQEWQGLDAEGAADIAKEWVKEFDFEGIVGDTGGAGKVFEAAWHQRFYLPMRPAKKADKLGHIKLLNSDLNRGKVKVLPGNDDLVKCVRELPWKDDTQTKEHPGASNHLSDALLYMWRDARHWDWTAADESHLVTELEAQLERERTRKERIVERNRKLLNDDDNDWIMGPEA